MVHSVPSTDPSQKALFPDRPDKRRRWYRRGLVLLLLLLGFYLLRYPLLRGVAEVVIADEPSSATDWVFIHGGDRRFEQGARLYQRNPALHFLLIEPPAGRLQQMKILPSGESLTRCQLGTRGVPDSAVTLVPCQGPGDWRSMHCLEDWLHGHPHILLTVLCDQFSSRRLRYILHAVLGPENALRVRVCALPHRWYNETDWWRHKEGVLGLFNAYVSLAYARFEGEDSQTEHEWDPDEYERTIGARAP